MHKTLRGFVAALLIALLMTSLPAAAAPRTSRTQQIVQAARRLVDTLVPWLFTRLSPPGGDVEDPDDPPPDPGIQRPNP